MKNVDSFINSIRENYDDETADKTILNLMKWDSTVNRIQLLDSYYDDDVLNNMLTYALTY